MKTYVYQAFTEIPWAILPSKLLALEEVVLRHVAGEKLDADEVQTVIHGAKRPDARRVNSVAVIPLFGTIFPRANMMTDISGATSAETLGKTLDDLVADPSVGAIVLDVDSPGGQVNGIDELSKKIFDARSRKPIVAVANHVMASAAYWLGSSASEVIVSPSADIGSIGVFTAHRDMSAAMEKEGVKMTLISQGKYKVEGNPYQPLGEEAYTAIQERVNESYNAFVNAVARNRNVTADAVRNGFGEGRTVGARQALALGMADRIETLDETIARLLSRPPMLNTVGVAEMVSPADDDQAQELREMVAQILKGETHA